MRAWSNDKRHSPLHMECRVMEREIWAEYVQNFRLLSMLLLL
jgi:hypothetical protein